MDATQAFTYFVRHCLSHERALRLTALVGSERGERKILDGLYHEFMPANRPDRVRSQDYEHVLDESCFVYSASMGFGAVFSTVREALLRLSAEDGWLILLTDGSAGIHRPEDRWDDEVLILC